MQGFVRQDSYSSASKSSSQSYRSYKQVSKNNRQLQPTFPPKSIYNLLKKRATKNPKGKALHFYQLDQNQTHTLDNLELFDQATRLAQSLLVQHGLKPGDRIGLNFKNSPAVLLLHLASWMIGVATVPLDLLKDDQANKLYKLEFTDCKLLFTNKSALREAERKLFTQKLPKMKIIDVPDNGLFGETLGEMPLKPDHEISNWDATGRATFTNEYFS
jgi:acyl-CoA synthetase (AMP-forming)/AMP-acid ligase II